METNSIAQAILFAVLGIAIFNWLKYTLELSFINSLVLSISVLCNLLCFYNKVFGIWFSEYIFEIIVLSVLVAFMIVFGRAETEFKKSDNNKTAKNEQANSIFNDGKG